MRVAATVALCAALASCGKEEWRGWIYPSAANSRHYFDLGAFPDEASCRKAGESILRHYSIATFRQRDDPSDWGRIDCGRGCKKDDGTGLNVCEDVVRRPLR